jgi:hypothetical protein
MEAVDVMVVASARFGIFILQAQEPVNQLHGRRLQNGDDI